ncbi:MAG TPA: fatty acid CoA ligase family protein [Gemmataceae bacterium]|jgi:acyl-CoA synthetase (AMP-forming)/AMP-acid ligase II|nr:fatty acid CoA ligase family protein [Gemmataceae bacterium]
MTDTSFVNIAAHLPAMAQRQPETSAIMVPGRGFQQLTYRQLNQECDRMAHGLKTIGIGRGVRTVLMTPPSPEFFALTFALFKIGAIPVMIDPGIGLENLRQCLVEAGPEAFIGIPKAHIARLLFGWARKSIRINITIGRRFFWGGYSLNQVRRLGDSDSVFEPALTNADDTAAILFTSGSTGPPKGAVYTHGIFAAQVELLKKTYGIQPGEIDLPTFPLFALFAPALGMTAVIPDMDFTRPGQVDPRKIISAIQDFRVTNLFGSPALIDRVGRYGETHHVRLPTLRRVISAGAPVSAETTQRFAGLLAPGVQVFTPYGATEALPVSSIGSDEILGETKNKTAQGGGVCVGRPVKGMTVRIIRISDEPIPTWSDDLLLPAGYVGEIVVDGPVVTKEYFNRPQSTALAKILDPDNGRIIHRMGDLGYLDEHGRVWFCGRKSQRVITPSGTLFTIPCEAVFNQHPKVYRSALVGVSKNGTTHPVLCVEVEKNTKDIDLESLKREILKLGAQRTHTRGIQIVLFHPRFPVDIRHNAKIFREKLASWAARQLA